MHTAFHPAPGAGNGLGMFLPATWTIPENPLKGYLGLTGMDALVDGIATPFSNPVVDEIKAKMALDAQLKKYPVGLSCGPSVCPCQVGLCGLGDLSTSLNSLMSSVTGSLSTWQTWALVGAGVAALVLFTGGGGSQRRAELAAAKAKYRAEVARVRAERPRRYQKYL